MAVQSSQSLSPDHRDLLVRSGLTAETIAARGYYSTTSKTDQASLGYSRSQCNVPALVIPLMDLSGQHAGTVLRPDCPRTVRGQTAEYELPYRVNLIIDVPPSVRDK